MGLLDTIRSSLSNGLAKVGQATKSVASDYVLSKDIEKRHVEVKKLERRLVQLERSTDSFSSATGQRVERSDVMLLRQVLTQKKTELQALEAERARKGTLFPSQREILANMR